MDRVLKLKQNVESLYFSKDPQADAWIDWGYPNHVLVVVDYAEKIAKKHGANAEFVVAGALLHDIADAVMDRDLPGHEKESLAIAEKLLTEAAFSSQENEIIIHQIIEPHSCSSKMPETLDGKIVATADGVAHFITDFYPYFCWQHYGPDGDYEKFRKWALQKIEKDYTKKIFFDEVKQEILPKYEALKLVFSD